MCKPSPALTPLAARVQLEHHYSRLGLDPVQLRATHKGTIVDPSLEALHEAWTVEAVPETLAEAAGVAHGAAPPPRRSGARVRLDSLEVVLGAVVGTGGMGVVNVAEQPTLRREVAVKRVRPERTTPSSVDALLREAWVTGLLEHPNIVPVHLLLDDASGDSPRVVMKRVEGLTWDALLESAELVSEFSGGARAADDRDQLLFHLRILIEVCRAIHFAHSRGVLHLDLKPENVMVGRFGEVYVVDWGIAARIASAAAPDGKTGVAAPEWLPLATSIKSVRGTPSWLAPELATAEGDRVGVTTDVYLLGGLLHAVLTGNERRHRGEELIDLLAAAYLSLPYKYDARVPSELAALANRATARDPADRPQSAEAFRRALEDYLEHRNSTDLEARATASMDRLLAVFARAKRGIGEGTQVGQNLRKDFLECRFAFRQALEIWPDNQRAKDGLQTVLRAMATFALDHDQLERAAESVAELSPPDRELEQRLEALQQQYAQRHERLIALERDASIDEFREKRSWMALVVGLMFVAWNVACGLLHRSGAFVFEASDLLWFNGMTIAAYWCTVWLVRKSLLTTATNRRLVVLLGSGLFAVLVFWFTAWVHGLQHQERELDALEIVALSNWAYTFFALAVAFTMDARAAWIAIPVTVLAVLAPMFEDFAFEVLGLEGFLCGAGLAFIWRQPGRRKPSVFFDG